MKRDSGKPPDQPGTARCGSLRGKMPERPERQWKWRWKNGQKVSVAAHRGSLRGKTVRETRAAVESEGEGNSESFRNRAPRVFERKIALETQAVMEMEAEEWSESLRSRAPRVFEGKTVRETRAASEMEAEEWSESLRSRAPWVFERKNVRETRAESEME